MPGWDPAAPSTGPLWRMRGSTTSCPAGSPPPMSPRLSEGCIPPASTSPRAWRPMAGRTRPRWRGSSASPVRHPSADRPMWICRHPLPDALPDQGRGSCSSCSVTGMPRTGRGPGIALVATRHPRAVMAVTRVHGRVSPAGDRPKNRGIRAIARGLSGSDGRGSTASARGPVRVCRAPSSWPLRSRLRTGRSPCRTGR